MKKLIIISIIGILFVPIHIEHMKLKAKRDEYKRLLDKIRKENVLLTKKRDRLKNPSYDTIREEAIKLGLIREEEKIIRFYK